MTTNFKNKRKKLMKLCGLPETLETSHCFNDDTHQTCCMLGDKSRSYADGSKNPIGEASMRAYKEFTGKKPSKEDLTPWCTCIGSNVCSYYAKQNKDGTNIKFINVKSSIDEIIENVDKDCEEDISNELKYRKHSTPGIYNKKNNTKKNKNNKKKNCTIKKKKLS